LFCAVVVVASVGESKFDHCSFNCDPAGTSRNGRRGCGRGWRLLPLSLISIWRLTPVEPLIEFAAAVPAPESFVHQDLLPQAARESTEDINKPEDGPLA